jgi:hypothetical protein
MDGGDRAGTLGVIRRDLAARLRLRRAELEEAIMARLGDMPDPLDRDDADYISSLRRSIAAATEDALVGIEEGEAWPGSFPPTAAAHARRVARSGVKLETSLRRGAAAEQVRQEFLVREAAGVPPWAMCEILRRRGLHFDRLMASFAEEYRRETKRIEEFAGRHRAELVLNLLSGAPVEASELDYALDTWHLGIIATGPGAGKAVRRVRMPVGFQLLSVLRDKETVWAWLGSARPLCAAELQRSCPHTELAGISLALGEPGHGVEGWRLTHRQAQAAQWVALQRRGELTRYADELLLVAALKDGVLATSLRETYLSPLDARGEGNGLSATTLRAYFTSGCNAATAAAALRVDRHTVQRRLQRIEERLGRSIHDCRAELEVALRLEEFTQASTDRESDAPPKPADLATAPVGSAVH